MDLFPIHLRVTNRRCVVIGGGKVALRKTMALLESGAKITLVAPEILPELKDLLREQGGEVLLTSYSPGQLDGAYLVVAATNQTEINQQIAHDAESRQLLVNVVDSPEASNFIVPAVVNRSPLLLSISCGGLSPVFTRILRAKMEVQIPPHYGRLAALLGRYRNKVKARFKALSERRQFWDMVLEGPVAEQFMSGNEAVAEQTLNDLIERGQTTRGSDMGEVFLVGAGPGDPDLITFRALRLLQKADVVLYDRLVSKDMLDLMRRDSHRIYVGKSKSNHAMPQEKINEALVHLAKQGYRVCRLKGGDPFIFGRGGEEIELLVKEKVPFQVVPGITAATGCASYAGIPLTHRDYAQSVRFVAGHLQPGGQLDWAGLVSDRETLVVYMGMSALTEIVQQLMAHGAKPTLPIALIEQGTTYKQRVVLGTLESITSKVGDIDVDNPIESPVLIIIGRVVELHESFCWYRPSGDLMAFEGSPEGEQGEF